MCRLSVYGLCLGLASRLSLRVRLGPDIPPPSQPPLGPYVSWGRNRVLRASRSVIVALPPPPFQCPLPAHPFRRHCRSRRARAHGGSGVGVGDSGWGGVGGTAAGAGSDTEALPRRVRKVAGLRARLETAEDCVYKTHTNSHSAPHPSQPFVFPHVVCARACARIGARRAQGWRARRRAADPGLGGAGAGAAQGGAGGGVHRSLGCGGRLGWGWGLGRRGPRLRRGARPP